MNLGRKVTENQGKMKNMRFLLKFILSLQKSVVTLHRFNGEHGRLAQLVQSICLTSRGSGVRIPQRPLNRQSSASPHKAFPDKDRALSSAGSEHLPYKQRVGGSNPSAPTQASIFGGFFHLLPKFRFRITGRNNLMNSSFY